MTIHTQSSIKQYALEQLTSERLLLSLYFKQAIPFNPQDRWFETIHDLPKPVQQQLANIDVLLIKCKNQGLCAKHGMTILGGILFYDAKLLQTYSNRYIHQDPESYIKNHLYLPKTELAEFTRVDFCKDAAIVHIETHRNKKYSQQLTDFLSAENIPAMLPDNHCFCQQS